MDQEILSVSQAAEFLGVSKETIYRMIKAKTIPVYRIGKLWKFKRKEIYKMLSNK